MEKSLFTCPLCAAPLTREGRSYTCPNGHCYDVAREGYVHLLPANQKHSKSPGDDKGMVAARNQFLSAGYYAPLRDALCALALRHTGPSVSGWTRAAARATTPPASTPPLPKQASRCGWRGSTCPSPQCA